MGKNGVHMTVAQLLASQAGQIPANRKLIEEITGKKVKVSAVLAAGNKPGDKEKAWMQEELQFYCNKNLMELKKEYRFAPPRLFRFDWAIINPVLKLKVAIEYEGLMSEKSGHTTVKGYTKDTDKYRLASELGWHVMRFTVVNYKNVIEELISYISHKDY